MRITCSRKALRNFAVLILFVLFFGELYLVYERFYIKDEESAFLSLNTNFYLEEDTTENSYSMRVNVYSHNCNEKSCILNYCVLNNCEYYIELPLDKFRGEEYQGVGKYIINLSFENYKLTISNKKFLKEWTLKIVGEGEAKIEGYLLGIKELFEEKYIWESFSIPIPPNSYTTEKWFVQKKISFTNDYFKSVYLLGELAKRLGDAELEMFFLREINYLNSNKKELIDENKDLIYPEAYIFKLVENGLSEDYLILLDTYEIQDYDADTMIVDLGEEFLLDSEKLGSPYSREYLDVVRYSDYYTIFKEYELKELSDYVYYKMLDVYTSSELVTYGLCSLVNSERNLVKAELLKERLEYLFSNNAEDLIEKNLYELVVCGLYFNNLELKVSGLDYAIEQALNMQKVLVGKNSFIVRALPADGKDKVFEGPVVINNFNLVDNLTYLLYSL
jgi:hypothetical protein